MRITQEDEEWFLGLDEFVQLKIRAGIERLKRSGPSLGRPDVDTLYGAKKVKNLKEMRVNAQNRPYRIFFLLLIRIEKPCFYVMV
ncbi:type II toxin-antitoxin system RelE/ParE family toxin [Microbulbifer echini]|uniref:Type II toxin-antitoxin system RelE/ParE family toxin n=1 Tax=Microbulbifer echini TaxID=1529067 RepID=A0ABV4NT20_9GAMM